jgi:PKD repeat protein
MISNSKSRWKLALISIALLLTFFSASNTALAGSCSTNCLSVYSITLTDLGNTISGIVKLVDETGAGAGARGAVVHAIWTRPDGSTFDQYANIGTRLRAAFSLYTAGAPGTYTLTVADATKPGYKFDPGPVSKSSESITIAGSGNQPPIAVPNADTLSGGAPLTVNFDSDFSTDPGGEIVAYAWDFGDGAVSSEPNPIHTYLEMGNYTSTLTVTDDMGATASGSVSITVTDSNAGCINNCMSVDQISLGYKMKSGAITGQVWIYDENNNRINNAVVHAVWTLPEGTTNAVYSTTNSRSKATFTLNDAVAGHYDLTIVEVVKDGFTFDPDSSNALAGSIDIAP